jgi:hypothetical protein
MSTHYKIFFLTIFLVIFLVLVTTADFSGEEGVRWGVTYSKKYATDLGLNWRELYLLILHELKFKNIRLPVYWDEVERVEGVYNFADYDWLMEQAGKTGAEVVLVLGRRVPRWPECHEPSWVRNESEGQKQEKILRLLREEVNHFKKYSHLKIWQIDNEPFLKAFGECPKVNKDFIKREVGLVKSFDFRPVMVTESGELSSWISGARLADVLGISMYRNTWNKYWGYFYYPLPPAYYFFKAKIIKTLTGVGGVINTELQVEPWAKGGNIKTTDLADQFYSMDLESVRFNLEYARKTGIPEIYLWGVEWWYWLKTEKDHPEFWQLGRGL